MHASVDTGTTCSSLVPMLLSLGTNIDYIYTLASSPGLKGLGTRLYTPIYGTRLYISMFISGRRCGQSISGRELQLVNTER